MMAVAFVVFVLHRLRMALAFTPFVRVRVAIAFIVSMILRVRTVALAFALFRVGMTFAFMLRVRMALAFMVFWVVRAPKARMIHHPCTSQRRIGHNGEHFIAPRCCKGCHEQDTAHSHPDDRFEKPAAETKASLHDDWQVVVRFVAMRDGVLIRLCHGK